MTVLGSQASVNNTSIKKNEAGVYNVDFKVATSGLTDNSNSTAKAANASKIRYVWYFVVTGGSGLKVRSIRSTKDNNSIVGSVPSGGANQSAI